VAVLAGLDLAVGLTSAAWLAGLAVGVGVAVLLGLGLARAGRGVGPADVVTLARSNLVGGVAALVVARADPAVLAPVAVVALALDWVDGRVARRSGTASDLGGRFDMEVDAFLVLLLSWHVSTTAGAWVLLIGLARYLKLAASWAWPWLGATARPRRWARVVAAVQGVVLVVAGSGVLPPTPAAVILLLALALLTESFATEIRWLWRHRDVVRPRPRRLAGTVVALLAVSAALVAPHAWERAGTSSWRLPLEAVAYAAVVLLVPPRLTRARHVVTAAAGVLLAVLALLKALDLGFSAVLNRPFDPLVDWAYVDELVALVQDSTSELLGPVLLAALATAVVALLVGLPLAVRRLTRVLDARRPAARRGLAAAVSLWLATVLTAAGGGSAPAVVGAGTASYAWHQVARVPGELRARAAFERLTHDDPVADIPADRLLAGLRDKDVLVVFVESYGRVALTDPAIAPGVDAVLEDGTARLADAGFAGRSAWLTSPTFGALSWLAHASLQTGLWVDSQARYDALVDSPRMSLTRLFGRAGWRTVASVPANTEDWPQGAFYGFDHLYDSRNVGYRGPRFGYPTMPDQFTLEAFWRHELAARERRPVMAEIDLISSHAPWSRTPRMVDPVLVGDGSVFDGMPEQLPSEPEIWTSPQRVRAAYGEAVEYSLTALLDFVARHGDDDLVVVALGDHQPATVVSGADAGHDVPVTVLARDPAVLERIEAWGWQDGLRPADDAPVWRMDAFRDQFLAAYDGGAEDTGHADVNR
jgi:phosphatidylglycerophosphate synthase